MRNADVGDDLLDSWNKRIERAQQGEKKDDLQAYEWWSRCRKKSIYRYAGAVGQ